MQIDLFSAAIEHKQKALDALQRFALPQARTELVTAGEIDPYLADINTLLQAVDILLDFGLSANTKSSGLAAAWKEVRTARATLPRAVYARVERAICQRALQCLPADYSDFVAPKEKTLHAGYCCLVLNRPDEAYKKLLDYLTGHPDESHPALWGYFGDACCQLKRHDETNSGYLRALLTDAQAVDFTRLRHPDLRRIFKQLCSQHLEETSRALLPIHAWLEGVLHIPKGAAWLARTISRHRDDQSAELAPTPAQRYRQFALCLFIDQSGLHGDIAFDSRVEMQRLDAPLFRRYLREVDRKNSARRRPLGKR